MGDGGGEKHTEKHLEFNHSRSYDEKLETRDQLTTCLTYTFVRGGGAMVQLHKMFSCSLPRGFAGRSANVKTPGGHKDAHIIAYQYRMHIARLQTCNSLILRRIGESLELHVLQKGSTKQV